MWLNECTLYQIYPLGFCGAPEQNDGVVVSRIRKVVDWIPHFTKLGIGAVLFNPIFESDQHGYDTRNYEAIDVRLGTNEDFKYVCEKLHEAGIRVILDGVFNHVGRGFFGFEDVVKNRERSEYKDWFYINFNQNNGYDDELSYEGWEGHYELVKLNLQNPKVVQYLLGCVRFWVDEFGIDGLRLDVAYCLDRNFMKTLRGFCKELKPEFPLIGEVLFGDYKQIVNEEMLDSCTNYECYKGIYSSCNDLNLFEISYSLNRQFGPDNGAIYKGLQLMNFVDNHDVSRIASILKDKKHLKVVYGILMTMPGFPCIYYGSEWGIEGEKAKGDAALRPDCEEPVWNELTDWIAKLIEIKKESKALAYGDYRNVTITNQQLVYEREYDGEKILVACNLSSEEKEVNLKVMAKEATDLITGETEALEGHKELEADSFYIWSI